MQEKSGITILGIYATDLTFMAARQPAIGETIAGTGFVMGPGGKGSNQAVAAAKCGGEVRFITRVGDDTFAKVARDIWQQAGVTACVIVDTVLATGAANIFVNDATGDNAIIVVAGASGALSGADVDSFSDEIKYARVFMTQLEQPVEAALQGLKLAYINDTITILNPAPAVSLPAEIFALCDYITPNEVEAQSLTGLPVNNIDDAHAAAKALLTKGAKNAVITLGGEGVVLYDGQHVEHIPAFEVGEVVDTTGAGDAFNGGFAASLARGDNALMAARFGCAVAGIAVTRQGAANSMPVLEEVMNLLENR